MKYFVPKKKTAFSDPNAPQFEHHLAFWSKLVEAYREEVSEDE